MKSFQYVIIELLQQAKSCNYTASLMNFLDVVNNCSIIETVMDDMETQLTELVSLACHI